MHIRPCRTNPTRNARRAAQAHMQTLAVTKNNNIFIYNWISLNT